MVVLPSGKHVSWPFARPCARLSSFLTWLAHTSLALKTIARFGTEEQRLRYVSRLASGETLGAFALTEPTGGSDAAAMQVTAIRADGGYYLSGTKTFITNGDVAGVLVVFATTDPALRARGVCAFIVDGGSRGLTTQRMAGKMGMRGSSTAQVFFDRVYVPEENRMGDVGGGFRLAVQALDASRAVIAAQCVGIAQACLDTALAYVRERRLFGKALAEHQAVQEMLADMSTEIDAARLLTWRAASIIDAGQPHTAGSSKAKLFASETAVRCASRALQVHGGYGYFRPSAAERLYRDARVTTIYEGASEIQRTVIARYLTGNR